MHSYLLFALCPKKPRTITMASLSLHFLISLFLLLLCIHSSEQQQQQQQQQPLNPVTVPAHPTSDNLSNQTCRLDLSAELFGGVAEACGQTLDRGRCCPVLAAWLFAAHARSALDLHSGQEQTPSMNPTAAGDVLPVMPDSDSQRCVDALQSSLASRDIRLPKPNATCDTVLCFCGIRLHELGSLSCPAAFNVSGHRNVTPTPALKELERSCGNASHAGCTRCLGALHKLEENKNEKEKSETRSGRMMKRDCQLMGLTWLLTRNRTAFIPTVSAVLRAILYTNHPQQYTTYTCSPDQENMPLAVDSLQFRNLDSSSSASYYPRLALNHLPYSIHVVIFFLLLFQY
ncbi:putative SPARK domain-containing protein [Dioscorea sansibarensis]